MVEPAGVAATPLVPARFVDRPNRFIVRARLRDGARIEAHLADPGRLRELLLPDAELRLRPAAPGGQRRTSHTVSLVRGGDPARTWVSVETTRANRLAESLLLDGRVHGIDAGWTLRREVRFGDSRFDFELRRGDESMVVEVKSVTLVEDGIGRFPDAPTARGARHVEELTRRAAGGGNSTVLFVVQRGDANEVTPHAAIDPRFTAALIRAQQAGVRLRAAAFALDGEGQARYAGSLPVRLRVSSHR